VARTCSTKLLRPAKRRLEGAPKPGPPCPRLAGMGTRLIGHSQRFQRLFRSWRWLVLPLPRDAGRGRGEAVRGGGHRATAACGWRCLPCMHRYVNGSRPESPRFGALAQGGAWSASAWGAEGSRFKSLRSDQSSQWVTRYGATPEERGVALGLGGACAAPFRILRGSHHGEWRQNWLRPPFDIGYPFLGRRFFGSGTNPLCRSPDGEAHGGNPGPLAGGGHVAGCGGGASLGATYAGQHWARSWGIQRHVARTLRGELECPPEGRRWLTPSTPARAPGWWQPHRGRTTRGGSKLSRRKQRGGGVGQAAGRAGLNAYPPPPNSAALLKTT